MLHVHHVGWTAESKKDSGHLKPQGSCVRINILCTDNVTLYQFSSVYFIYFEKWTQMIIIGNYQRNSSEQFW